MSQAPMEIDLDWDAEELVTAVDNDTVIVSKFGPVPQALMDAQTVERCVVCGREAGTVDRFDLGVNHALARLSTLFQRRGGVPKDEAEAIVAKLRAADVELP